MSRHNHFPAGLKCIMDLCACRTHLPKILHLAELIFWIEVFQTTQNSPAETDTFLWNAELTCWNTFLWNAELTCWNRHIPVECRTNMSKQTHSFAMHNIPAGLDFAPGTGYVFPTVLQKCSPHSTRQLQLNSDALPSESLVHGSTVLPLPASYVLTDLAPLRVPNQSHRSSNTTKNMTACAAQYSKIILQPKHWKLKIYR